MNGSFEEESGRFHVTPMEVSSAQFGEDRPIARIEVKGVQGRFVVGGQGECPAQAVHYPGHISCRGLRQGQIVMVDGMTGIFRKFIGDSFRPAAAQTRFPLLSEDPSSATAVSSQNSDVL